MTEQLKIRWLGRHERLKWRLLLFAIFTVPITCLAILSPESTRLTWQESTSAGKLNFATAFVVGLMISEVVRDLLNAFESRTNPTCTSRRDGLLDAALTVTFMLAAGFTWYVTGFYVIFRGGVQLYSVSAVTVFFTVRNVRAWMRAQPRRRRPKKR